MLNLQIRPPDTGMMIRPDDLDEFRQKNIRVIVTCHEYMLNIGRRSELNTISQSYFQHADRVIFFNEQDGMAAIEKSRSIVPPYSPPLYQKTSLAQVAVPGSLCIRGNISAPPMPPILRGAPEELLAKRPNNILFFGLIRRGKGFDNIIPSMTTELLQKQRQGHLQGVKIIVVGGVSDISLVAELISSSFKTKTPVNEVERTIMENRRCRRQVLFGLTLPPDSPIEFHLDKPHEDLPSIFATCKYACLYGETKGFAFNASSMITVLAHGCILFANTGNCTPLEVFTEHEGSIIFNLNPKEILDEIECRETNQATADSAHSLTKTSNYESLQKQALFFRSYFGFEALQHIYLSIFSLVAASPDVSLESATTAQQEVLVWPPSPSQQLQQEVLNWIKVKIKIDLQTSAENQTQGLQQMIVKFTERKLELLRNWLLGKSDHSLSPKYLFDFIDAVRMQADQRLLPRLALTSSSSIPPSSPQPPPHMMHEWMLQERAGTQLHVTTSHIKRLAPPASSCSTKHKLPPPQQHTKSFLSDDTQQKSASEESSSSPHPN